jgi:hypothetical protein
MRDQELAIPQLAQIEVSGVTRSSFILRSALAAGAVYGAASVSPFVRQAFAQGGGGDVDVLNFALTLEVLEATFYERGLDEVQGMSGKVRKLSKEIQSNEAEHVDGLTKAIQDLGGTPVEAPQLDFGNAFASEKAFLELAQTLEDTGVSAYNGAGPSLRSKDLLGTAGAIVQIEGRHAALIRLQRGETPAPESFDKTLEKQEVLDAVMPFIKG